MMFRVAVLLFALAALAAPNPINEEHDEQWTLWKKTFSKSYDADTDLVRRIIWETNLKHVQTHNLEYSMGKHTYTLGMNEYADMTNAEFVHFMNGYIAPAACPSTCSQFLASENIQVPSTMDWRTKGYVTGIKNQKQCGSCWAFSTTGSLEGQHFKKTGKLVSLSEQNLVDCSDKECNMGCQGGLMDQAFAYIKLNHGIDTEQCYPYKARNGKCHYNSTCSGATVTGCMDVTSGSETDLLQAAGTVGPISVAIDASHLSFQLYRTGVYNEPRCSSTRLDHGVLVIGYGTDGGKDYWLVKNSWGKTWGMSGYIKMSRNKDNQCGIATSASYPLV